MTKEEDTTLLVHGIKLLFRYGLVGLVNSLIDFAFTNLFVILFGASSAGELFIASFTACCIATVNSYFLNRTWTFQGKDMRLPNYAMAKYFMVAVIAMLSNTSAFLFIYHYLSIHFQIPRMLGINLAKLCGVGVGAIIAFLGFRISIFRPQSLLHFRESFQFSVAKIGYTRVQQIVVLVVSASIVRGLYLCLTTSIYGDAANYGWIAGHIAKGEWSQVEGGWVSLFSYWEALFYLIGLDRISAAILASFIPGVLLLIPVTWTARTLYGESVAWLAGAVTVLHPRLVEYSASGYPEMFYLLLFTTAIACLTESLKRKTSQLTILTAAASMGLYFVASHEALFAILLLLIGIWVMIWRARRHPNTFLYSNTWLQQPVRSTASFFIGCIFAIACWGLLSYATTGKSQIYSGSIVLMKRYSEQLDPRKSAKEVYGIEGIYTTGELPDRSWSEQAQLLIQRIPRNFIHMLRALPGILLTPLCFFALLYPVFCRSQPPKLHPEWPLLVMLLVPLIVFPPLQIEPRHFMSTLIPIHIFGCATLVALSYFVREEFGIRYLMPILAFGILALCTVIVIWRGYDLERRYAYHRDLAHWIQAHVDPQERIVGGGYGFVSTTGFLANRKTVNRVWTYDPGELVSNVINQDSQWLILYETFIRKANPELLGVLNYGLPQMKKVYETRDNLNQRVQIYRLQKTGTEPIQSSNVD